MAGKTILFVYGTLKRGERNHSHIGAGVFLGEAVTLPHYRVYDLGAHPAMVRDEADGLAVRGELWAVDGPTLAALDGFEEVPDLFVRESIGVDGRPEVVEAYFFARSVPGDTPSGDQWPPVSREAEALRSRARNQRPDPASATPRDTGFALGSAEPPPRG